MANQKFRAYVRKTAGTPNPTIDVELWENGSSVATLLNDTAITSTTGQLVEASWNANLLTTASGANVECRIVSTVGSSVETAPVLTAGTAFVATTGSAVTLPYPASLASGDIIGAFFVGQGRTTSVPDVTVPANWTALAEDIGANNQCKIWVLIRDARSDGTETGNMPDFVVATPGTGGVVGGVQFKVSGVTATSFTEQGASDTGTGVTITHDPVTTQGTNRLVACFVGVGGAVSPGSFTGESGGDLASVFADTDTTGDDIGGSIQTATIAGSGTTLTGGTITITSDDWATYTVAFIPTAAGAVNTVEIDAIDWLADYELVQQDFSDTPANGTLAIVGYEPTVAGGTGATAEPTTAAISLTAEAPTVAAGANLQPTIATISVTGFALDISAGHALTPDTAALAIVAETATVTASSAPVPSTATVALIGQDATLAASSTAAPTTADLTLTGFAPTVSAGQVVNVDVTPDAATLAVVGEAPTLAASATAEPTTAAIALAAEAPTVVAGSIAEPSTAALALIGEAPVFGSAVTFAPDTATLAIAAEAPTLAASSTAAPAEAMLALTGETATFSAHFTATPDTATVAIIGQDATVAAGAIAQPDTAIVALLGYEPDVFTAASGEVNPLVGTLTITGFAPTVSTSHQLALSTATLTLEGQAPAVEQGAGGQPTTATIGLTGFAPTVSAGYLTTTITGTVQVTGFAPTVSAGAVIEAEEQVAALAIVGQAPAFTSYAVIPANDASLALTGFAPTLRMDTAVTLGTATIELTGYAPLIIKVPPPPRRILPVGTRDRQFAVSGRRRAFRSAA